MAKKKPEVSKDADAQAVGGLAGGIISADRFAEPCRQSWRAGLWTDNSGIIGRLAHPVSDSPKPDHGR